ncbi:hypothetical protein GCM10011511_32130 [Puia dinghuensis]|uniref:Polysaccharide biosynthesis protein C-terminal domain-containing protein n=2 Tax=Puia dinghuensis TaxID=1792502 RepID=A0A8J2XTU7_9BACT|nr:hypothetical protein GCM10011511_32130 [Puia dinghuensis]
MFINRLVTVLSLDILVKASAIVLLPVYLHLMTQEQYGIFNYTLSIAYSFSAILNLGLYIPQSKLYHDEQDPQQRGKLIYSINLLLLAGLLVFVLPAYFFGLDHYAVRFLFRNPIHYDQYRPWILLLTLTSLFAYMLSNFFYTSEKIDSIKKYSLFRVIGINSISILALYFLRARDPIELRFIAIGAVELILLLAFYGSYIGKMVRVIDWQLIMKCLKLALPVMLSAVFGIIINFGDKFFLEKHVSYAALSVYYLATACAGVIALLSTSLQNVWLPLFFKEKDLLNNLRKTRKLVGRLVWILVALSVAIMAGVMVCLQLNLIPKSYSEIVYLLPLLLAGQIVICVALLYSNYLVYFERTSLILWSGLGVSLTSTLLNMTLIPVWKAYGAATTLLVSNGCYLVIYYLIVRYYKKRR